MILMLYCTYMKWIVKFYEKFEPEFDELDMEVQNELLAHGVFLEKFGPQLGRPYVDTLKAQNTRT